MFFLIKIDINKYEFHNEPEMDSESIPASISIYNKQIIEFYFKHKNMDFEMINLKFIEMFENIIPIGVNDTNESDVLRSVSHLCTEIHNLKKDNAVFITNTVEEFKNDIRGILQNTATDKITETIKDYMEMFQDKTKILLTSDNTMMLKEIHKIKS